MLQRSKYDVQIIIAVIRADTAYLTIVLTLALLNAALR
jgi:hypothetical protein